MNCKMNVGNKSKHSTNLHMKRVTWVTGSNTKRPDAKSSSSASRYSMSSRPYVHKTTGDVWEPKHGTSKDRSYGDLMQAIMCPKFTQLFLAFSTLLFFFSFEYFLYNIVTISPGLIGRAFTRAKCKVIHKFINGNTSCYVESLSNHGSLQVLPCLQIYVSPFTDDQEQTDSQNSISDNVRTILKTSSSQETSLADDQVLEASKCGSNCGNLEAGLSQNILLLYENEYNYASSDNIYRRCSYLPTFCSNDIKTMMLDMCVHAYRIGGANATIDCFYDSQNQRVILDKKINLSNIVHSLLWPILGIILSTACCVGFWNHNHKHISRLYIYNSWSAS